LPGVIVKTSSGVLVTNPVFGSWKAVIHTQLRLYIILRIVLHECETCFLALKEHHLRAFEGRACQRVLGPERGVTGGWKKLHT
jgi:hypothetical protein